MTKLYLDRDRLHDAINMCVIEKLYSCTTPLTTRVKIKSIGIKKVGEVKFPLQAEKVKELTNQLASARQPPRTGPIILDSTQLYEPKNDGTPINMILKEIATTAVQETFNINQSYFGFNVDAVLDRLVICSGKEVYKKVFNLQKEGGTFGTLLIQIPIAGVIGGSSISIHYGHESMFTQLDSHSDLKYYVTVIAGKRMITSASMPSTALSQDFTIKAARQSPCVMLVAHLVWTDTINSQPVIEGDRFPQFVEGAYQANKALTGWRPPTEITDEVPWVNTNVLNPTGHFFVQTNITNKLPLLDAQQIRALCIPLRHNYCFEALRIESLVDDDALIHKILSSINYLEVELVLYRSADVPSMDWREAARMKNERKVQIFKRCPIQGIRPLPLSVSVNQNFIGHSPGGNSRAGAGPVSQRSTPCTANNQLNGSYHAAFLIRPKSAEKVVKDQSPDQLNNTSSAVEGDVSTEEIWALVEELETTKDVSKPVTKTNENWELFYKLQTEKPTFQTFLAFSNLALETSLSNQGKLMKNCIESLTHLSVRALKNNEGYGRLICLMKLVKTLLPLTEDRVKVVETTVNQLTAAQIADLVLQNYDSSDLFENLSLIGRMLVKITWKGITASQMIKLLKIYADQKEMEIVKQLLTKICSMEKMENKQFLLSMLIAPKDEAEREALISQLANHAAIIKDALDAAVASFDIRRSPNELAELVSFLVASQLNEKLASIVRFNSFTYHNLHGACRLHVPIDSLPKPENRKQDIHSLTHVPPSGEQITEKEDDWAVKNALVPKNGKLEKFLRSNLQRQVFGRPYEKRKMAHKLGLSLLKLSPSPVYMEVKQDGQFFVVEIVKMRRSPPLADTGQSSSRPDDHPLCDARKTKRKAVPTNAHTLPFTSHVPPKINPFSSNVNQVSWSLDVSPFNNAIGRNETSVRVSRFNFPPGNVNHGLSPNYVHHGMPPHIVYPVAPSYFGNDLNGEPPMKRIKHK